MVKINTRVKTRIVENARSRSNSSNRWLQRQLNDPYVLQAQQDGLRSRAGFKITEINEKYKLFKPGMKVIDLGAAPGSWCQMIMQYIRLGKNKNAQLIALDLLEIEELANVEFLQGDFHDAEIKQALISRLGGELADIVVSDMAANTTGHAQTDHIRTTDLATSAYNFAIEHLKPGGHFITKIFRGGAEAELLNPIKKSFKTVKHFKPESSRKESTEIYLIALDKK